MNQWLRSQFAKAVGLSLWIALTIDTIDDEK